jgi:hypothetical protein
MQWNIANFYHRRQTEKSFRFKFTPLPQVTHENVAALCSESAESLYFS